LGPQTSQTRSRVGAISDESLRSRTQTSLRKKTLKYRHGNFFMPSQKTLSNRFVDIRTSKLLYLGFQWIPISDVTASFWCVEHREVGKSTSLMIFRSLPDVL